MIVIRQTMGHKDLTETQLIPKAEQVASQSDSLILSP